MSKQQSSEKRPDSDHKKSSAFASVAVTMWAFAAGGVLALLYLVIPGGAVILGGFDASLSLTTEAALMAGAFLHEANGLLIATGTLLVTLLPYLLGARGAKATNAYSVMALFALVVGGACWYSLGHPVDLLGQHLELPALPFGK